jgi:hypothetical protein
MHDIKSPLAGLRFHDLQNTAITKLAESQASDQTIMAIAGHVSRQMLEHYSHIRKAAKRVALDSISTPLPDAHAAGKIPDLGLDVDQNGNQIRKTKINVVVNSLN